MFISTTRLSVHNLPTSVDDKKLKTVILGLLADKSAKITEVSTLLVHKLLFIQI